MNAEKTRRYHIISIQDGCWQYLGHSKNYTKALGIVYEFIHDIIDEDDVFTVKLGYDEANLCFEEVTVTVPETNNHSNLEYPIIIFYEDLKDKCGPVQSNE